MIKLKAVLALAALVVVVGSMGLGQAELECNGAITAVETPAGTLYIDDRGVDSDGVWIYQESNGVEGLQSGGQSAILGDADVDDCTDPEGPTPDTLLI